MTSRRACCSSGIQLVGPSGRLGYAGRWVTSGRRACWVTRAAGLHGPLCYVGPSGRLGYAGCWVTSGRRACLCYTRNTLRVNQILSDNDVRKNGRSFVVDKPRAVFYVADKLYAVLPIVRRRHISRWFC